MENVYQIKQLKWRQESEYCFTAEGVDKIYRVEESLGVVCINDFLCFYKDIEEVMEICQEDFEITLQQYLDDV